MAVGPDEQEAVRIGATSGSNQVEAIITRMVQATIKLTARTNTGPCGSVELQAIAAVIESLIGTSRYFAAVGNLVATGA